MAQGEEIVISYRPNDGKEYNIVSQFDQQTYRRYPVKTELVSKETQIADFVERNLTAFFSGLPESEAAIVDGRDWYLYIAETVIAIMQGRSFLITEINPGFWAKFLCRFVQKTSYGIGLRSPYTMQLALDEAGLPRILFASFGSILGKMVGKRGIFYKLAGHGINTIDGPADYCLPPLNKSAKLGPKDPQLVAEKISAQVRSASFLSPELKTLFRGTVIIDANDLNSAVLGNDTDHSAAASNAVFKDNPLGQSRQQSPIGIVFRLT